MQLYEKKSILIDLKKHKSFLDKNIQRYIETLDAPKEIKNIMTFIDLYDAWASHEASRNISSRPPLSSGAGPQTFKTQPIPPPLSGLSRAELWDYHLNISRQQSFLPSPGRYAEQVGLYDLEIPLCPENLWSARARNSAALDKIWPTRARNSVVSG